MGSFARCVVGHPSYGHCTQENRVKLTLDVLDINHDLRGERCEVIGHLVQLFAMELGHALDYGH